MNVPAPFWLLLGLAAQLAFSARFLLQWIVSECRRRSVLPEHFWAISVVGATLLLAYAMHQRDPVIAAGQLLGLAIYLRNIDLLRSHAGHARHVLPIAFPALLGAAAALGMFGPASSAPPVLQRIDLPWLLLGAVGQLLFSARFVVQWWLSERAGEPVNPPLFWQLSISGSVLLLGYALHTGDPVVLLGQSLGLVLYARNLYLLQRAPSSLRTS